MFANPNARFILCRNYYSSTAKTYVTIQRYVYDELSNLK